MHCALRQLSDVYNKALQTILHTDDGHNNRMMISKYWLTIAYEESVQTSSFEHLESDIFDKNGVIQK